MDQLLSLLHSIRPLSPELDAHLRSILIPETFLKGEILLFEGQIADRIFFIEKGLVRSYSWKGNDEVSNWFMKEGDICISVRSFLRQSPAKDSIIALEDTETWSISYDQLQACYVLYPSFEHHGRILTEKYYLWREDYHDDVVMQTPKAIYDKLVETDPDLVRRVPPDYLATYLNFSRATYFRARRKYRRGNKY